MRRGPGISGLKNAAKARERYQQTGEEVKKTSLQMMKDQMMVFKCHLEEFAQQHKADIRKDPQFRAQFHTMCANIGVDPLASNKGMWAEVLGFGDFYYELGVQIVEACWATRPLNGGMMDLQSLLRFVIRRRGSRADPISEDDVVRSIKKLKVLGNGFDLVKIGSSSYLRSVPGELSTDTNKILELAHDKGYLSVRNVQDQVGWSQSRVDTALQALLRDGFAWIDDGDPDGLRLFWFPCIGTQQ